MNVIKIKCILTWQVSTYDHKFLGQQMGKLSRKVKFVCSVESNSAVDPDGLIPVLSEINALSMNTLFLATSTVTNADLTWLPSCKP